MSDDLDSFNKILTTDVKIYGSRAKENYRSGSDIDLTLFGSNLSQKLLNRISMALDDLMLPYSVDISNFDAITNADLVDHILRVGKSFYSR